MGGAILLWPLLLGAALVFQVGLNNLLREHLGHSVLAALASFSVGTLALLAYVIALRLPWPAASVYGSVPFWQWAGGVLGAFYVASAPFLAPRLGSATLLALIVTGQLIASVIFDHYALIGFPQHAVNLWRIVGVILLIAGAVMIVKN